MAVDTREKRMSMMNFVSGPGVHVLPLFEADGAVDLDDRQHLLDLYSGNALGAPAVAEEGRGSYRYFVRCLAGVLGI